jgi:hypothetical protein
MSYIEVQDDIRKMHLGRKDVNQTQERGCASQG